MFSKVKSVSLFGLESTVVDVEVDTTAGIPSFNMSGVLGTEVKESSKRVMVAIKNSGFSIKPQKITVNISPADIRKDGTGFDLPIAIGLLVSNGIIDADRIKDLVIVGELSLDGTVNAIKGVLVCSCEIQKLNKETSRYKLIVPAGNVKEAKIVKNIDVVGVESLKQLVAYINGEKLQEEEKMQEIEEMENCDFDSSTLNHGLNNVKSDDLDFADIKGQDLAKKATLVAVAGMHNICYVGPPGSGKSMLAKRISTIMPKLTFEEALQITKILSVSGNLDVNSGLVSQRPFRSPHHNVTNTAMLGGGAIPKPGEITLADNGILFLDELTEFSPKLLESLRQPLEDKRITIVRLNAAYTYPADFMLVAAMNPCKCGYFPDRNRCNCSEHDIRRYVGRISAPMWDRFDICIKTEEVTFKQLELYDSIYENDIHESDIYVDNTFKDYKNSENVQDEIGVDDKARDKKNDSWLDNKKGINIGNLNVLNSEKMADCVENARLIQQDRFSGTTLLFNSQMSVKDIKKYCNMEKDAKDFLEKLYEKLGLSARGYHKLLKVARTIADLEEDEIIRLNHISQAYLYRNEVRGFN